MSVVWFALVASTFLIAGCRNAVLIYESPLQSMLRAVDTSRATQDFLDEILDSSVASRGASSIAGIFDSTLALPDDVFRSEILQHCHGLDTANLDRASLRRHWVGVKAEWASIPGERLHELYGWRVANRESPIVVFVSPPYHRALKVELLPNRDSSLALNYDMLARFNRGLQFLGLFDSTGRLERLVVRKVYRD